MTSTDSWNILDIIRHDNDNTFETNNDNEYEMLNDNQQKSDEIIQTKMLNKFIINDQYISNALTLNNNNNNTINNDNNKLNLLKIIEPEILLKIDLIDPFNNNEIISITPEFELRCRIKSLENEKIQLQMEKEQLNIQYNSLKQNNESIIKIQNDILNDLNTKQMELENTIKSLNIQINQLKDELNDTKTENNTLKQQISNNSTNMDSITNKENNKEYIVYICSNCSNKIFDKHDLITKLRTDDNNFLVNTIYIDNITLGPRICKKFLKGLFKVNQIFCDGCLNIIGYKFIEAFEEWNVFKQGKYCIINNCIKQIIVK